MIARNIRTLLKRFENNSNSFAKTIETILMATEKITNKTAEKPLKHFLKMKEFSTQLKHVETNLNTWNNLRTIETILNTIETILNTIETILNTIETIFRNNWNNFRNNWNSYNILETIETILETTILNNCGCYPSLWGLWDVLNPFKFMT